jgi:hypothetical protein
MMCSRATQRLVRRPAGVPGLPCIARNGHGFLSSLPSRHARRSLAMVVGEARNSFDQLNSKNLLYIKSLTKLKTAYDAIPVIADPSSDAVICTP